MQTVFKGSLTHADSKRHIMHGFEVPENAVGLRAALASFANSSRVIDCAASKYFSSNAGVTTSSSPMLSNP